MTFARDGSEPVRCGLAVLAGFVLLSLAVGSCSSDDGDDGASGPSSTQAPASSTSTTVDRPDGPVADLSEELTGGDGIYIGAAEPERARGLRGAGVRGRRHGDVLPGRRRAGPPTASGRSSPDAAADYRTRVIVRRPADAADASGTVLVEWLNVSGGVDADPEFATLREEILRQGHTWVGVSAQLIGVEGGPVAVRGRRARRRGRGQGPQGPRSRSATGRWSTRATPSRTTSSRRSRGRSARARRSATLEPSSVVAVGESQSAFALVTYVNGVQPLTEAFDGFFVHSRGAAGLGLSEAGRVGRHLQLDRRHQDHLPHRHRRPDLQRADRERRGRRPQLARRCASPTPTGSGSGRCPAPRTPTCTSSASRTAEVVDCGVPINDGPFHVVAKAALRHLVGWVEGGEPPPEAPRAGGDRR